MEAARAISNLPQLTELTLNVDQVSDVCCETLSRLKNLTVLGLWNNNISYKGAGFLSQLTNLKNLGLSFNNIDPTGANHLSRLENLQVLNLSKVVFNKGCNNIGDGGAKSLLIISSLRELDLCNHELIQVRTISGRRGYML